ncbi:VWA domain-containing protein [candidate division KSB1 bacterium]|nr:VWA domain-containing protein [candidate division KSB1 bacterium]
MNFANPILLIFLAAVPLTAYWYVRNTIHGSQMGSVRFSNLEVLNSLNPSRKQRFRHILIALRMLTITLVVIALARPQSSIDGQEILTEGIDIILTLDVSSSMKAIDFKPSNRLEAAKMVASDFIQGRTNDRIGMVVFAGRSYTQCPLTLDYGILLSFLESIEIGMVEDGTAIGMAIANSVNRLRESKAKSKVVILLTDGKNNRGELDPITASQIARAMGVKIYTIGMGKQGTVMYPVDDPVFGRRLVPMQADIDEPVLLQIAENTGGSYFRATDEQKLKEIFDQIGEMEKTEIEIKEYTQYAELFEWYAIPAFILFLLEIILANTIFRKIP